MKNQQAKQDFKNSHSVLRYFNLERFALHDGPGIRTTLFLQGCPLHCPWCANPELPLGANPESQPLKNVLLFDQDKCTGCRHCIAACVNGAISFNALNGKVHTDRKRCTGCLEYVSACLSQARSGSVKELGIQEVADQLLRDAPYFKATCGGVTFSGGEPLMQINALLPLLQILKQAGISIAIETCGAAGTDAYLLADEYVDHWLFDLKSMDANWLKTWTGASLEKVLENLAAVCARKPERVILRMVIIPGLNDDMERFEQSAKLAHKLGVRQIDLLPYHTLGVSKYAKLEKPYFCPEGRAMKMEDAKPFAAYLEKEGLSVTIGG